MNMTLTSEYFGSVGITISQPKSGHRYGAESLRLADFVRAKNSDNIIELGSGVGVISFLVALRANPKKAAAIEIQRSLHDIAILNAEKNGLTNKIEFINCDFRDYARENKNSYDVVFSNPPFYKKGEGRISPNSQRSAARHELNGTIEELLESAHMLLKPEGHAFIVFKLPRQDELLSAAQLTGFSIARREDIPDNEMFLVELRK